MFKILWLHYRTLCQIVSYLAVTRYGIFLVAVFGISAYLAADCQALSPEVHRFPTGFPHKCTDSSAISSEVTHSFNTPCGLVDLEIVKQLESSGRPNAIGDGGKALGLYQLHSGVIKDYNRAHKTSYSHKDALNPQVCHLIASWYLHREIPRFLYHYKIKVSYKTILWAYNAGIGNVVKGRMPETTKRYIAKYERLKEKRS